jgi:uncharacterized YigZ family protein
MLFNEDTDKYKTIKSFSTSVFKDRGSRFIGLAYPVVSQEEIKPLIDDIKKEYHDARHHCYAYMIGYQRLVWRVNDDGEPSGTAGKPIIGQINSHNLTNIIVVVVRYFGGTLLGVPGLINAYRTAANEAIINSEIIECLVRDYYRLDFSYVSINDVMKILKEEGAAQKNQMFDNDCSMEINFRFSVGEKILGRLSRIENLKYTFIERR